MLTTRELLTQYRQKYGVEPPVQAVEMLEAIRELGNVMYQRGLRDGRKEKIRSEEAD